MKIEPNFLRRHALIARPFKKLKNPKGTNKVGRIKKKKKLTKWDGGSELHMTNGVNITNPIEKVTNGVNKENVKELNFRKRKVTIDQK